MEWIKRWEDARKMMLWHVDPEQILAYLSTMIEDYGELGRQCPWCNAPEGEDCVTLLLGNPVKATHKARLRLVGLLTRP